MKKREFFHNSIIQFAKETGSIKSRQVEELLGVKQRRARRILGENIDVTIPGKKQGLWEKIKGWFRK